MPCKNKTCPYGKKDCKYCENYIAPNGSYSKRNKTGLDTSDIAAYKRDWMRKYRADKRAQELAAEIERSKRDGCDR